MYLYFSVYILFTELIICNRATISANGPRKHVLTRDCIFMPSSIVGLEESQTKILRIDDLDGGAVIYSHDFEHSSINTSTAVLGHNYHSQYPLAFSCEVVVHAPIENGRIMISVDSFYLPASDQTCKDDFLYVFDSNTARSKAMPEAGGEQGLCLSQYPKFPVFSSKSYICIAFHTSNPPKFPIPKNEAVTPGFKITVTAFQQSQTTSCSEGRFYCGSVNNPASKSIPPVTNFNRDISASRSSVRLPSMGLCVSEKVCCDGVVNCPDGRDELPSLCSHFQGRRPNDQDNGFSRQFLSLGMTSSVSIVVAVAFLVVLCIRCTICICFRNRSNPTTGTSTGAAVNSTFNVSNRSVGGLHADTSALLNGAPKLHDANNSQMPQNAGQQQQPQQQMMLPPAKSMGNLCQPHQLPSNSPMLRHFQDYPLSSQPLPLPAAEWSAQPLYCPTTHHSQWIPQHQEGIQQIPQKQTSNLVYDQQLNLANKGSFCYMGAAPSTNVPSCPQKLQHQQPYLIHSTRLPYQHPETSLLVADGGIVYLGEIGGGGGGSGSGGSRLAASSRRRSGRALDAQSSSSLGGGPSNRGAQSSEGAPRTASNSSHSIGPSWSSSRGTTANNFSVNGSANIRPHYHHRHHHHRRRRHGGGGGGSSGKQSARNHSTNSDEKASFNVKL